MKSPDLAEGFRSHLLILWLPPLIAALGFLLGLTFYGPGAILLVWGISWFLGYLILFLEFRRTRRVFNAGPPARRWIPGERTAVVSAIVVAIDLALFLLWIQTPTTICGGGTSCPSSTGEPWIFGPLTSLQILELLYVLLLVGFVSITVSSRRLARAQRHAGSPGVGIQTSPTQARSA
jgi:hypothetical protein